MGEWWWPGQLVLSDVRHMAERWLAGWMAWIAWVWLIADDGPGRDRNFHNIEKSA